MIENVSNNKSQNNDFESEIFDLDLKILSDDNIEGSDVKVKMRTNNQGEESGNDKENTSDSQFKIGEPVLEQPEKNSKIDLGNSIFHTISKAMYSLISGINERRLDRISSMKKLVDIRTELVAKESQKTIEQANEIQKKKKKGIIGKILAILAVVASIVLIAAAVATGGALMGPALGAVFAIVAAVDVLANDSKITNKIVENTIGKLTEVVAKGLEKMNIPAEIAGIIATVLVVIIISLVSWKIASKISKSGADAAANAASNAKKASYKAAKFATKAENLTDPVDAANAAKKANNFENNANKFAHSAIQHAETAQKKLDKLDELVEKGKMTKLDKKYINAQQELDDSLQSAHDAIESAQTAKISAAIADNSVEAGSGLKKIQTNMDALKHAKAIDNIDEAQEFADIIRKSSEKMSNAAEVAIKRAKILRTKADDMASNVDALDKDYAKSLESINKIADDHEFVASKAKNLADEVGEFANEADDIVSNMKSNPTLDDVVETAHESFEDITTTTNKIDGMDVKIESQSIDDDIKIMMDNLDDLESTRWDAAYRTSMLTDTILDAGNAAYGGVIEIINAKLDYLVAEDEADLKQLQSLFAILDRYIDAMSEASDNDVETVSNLKNILENILMEKLPIFNEQRQTA